VPCFTKGQEQTSVSRNLWGQICQEVLEVRADQGGKQDSAPSSRAREAAGWLEEAPHSPRGCLPVKLGFQRPVLMVVTFTYHSELLFPYLPRRAKALSKGVTELPASSGRGLPAPAAASGPGLGG